MARDPDPVGLHSVPQTAGSSDVYSVASVGSGAYLVEACGRAASDYGWPPLTITTAWTVARTADLLSGHPSFLGAGEMSSRGMS